LPVTFSGENLLTRRTILPLAILIFAARADLNLPVLMGPWLSLYSIIAITVGRPWLIASLLVLFVACSWLGMV